MGGVSEAANNLPQVVSKGTTLLLASEIILHGRLEMLPCRLDEGAVIKVVPSSFHWDDYFRIGLGYPCGICVCCEDNFARIKLRGVLTSEEPL